MGVLEVSISQWQHFHWSTYLPNRNTALKLDVLDTLTSMAIHVSDLILI